MNYPNMHQQFVFFCFVFVSRNKHHDIYAIILNIQNPLSKYSVFQVVLQISSISVTK